ncbi:MAG: 50S ribosomal protein L24 [Phycisphaerae bacterium]|nr:50S ribosomal protein L24 [Phycisphaerae bacterium]|tara:strand:+ start:688 stop:1020 length:333 start_codon:yes stop_codon:yes gene_type:complete
MARHIKKGDTVVVTAGNDSGKVGEVLRVITSDDRVVVQGVNIRTRHMKPTQQNPQGGLLRKEMPIHISNVSPAVDGKPSRVRFETQADGTKKRIAVRGGKELHTLRGPRR